MLKQLGIAWTAWKIAAKRLGPIGGIPAAIAAVVGLVALKRLLRKRAPAVADELDEVV